MSKEARNEQRKLLATWLNNIGTGFITVGVFAPGFALLAGSSKAAASIDDILLIFAGALMAGFASHLAGRMMLMDYEP